MPRCHKCGALDRETAHIVKICSACGQESHDCEALNRLKCKLAAYKAAHKRLEALVAPSPKGQAIASRDGWLVEAEAVKEAMLLEYELFPIGGDDDNG